MELYNQVVLVCQMLVDLKLDSGPFGNVSVRIPDTNTFWVNPVGVMFDQLQPADIVKINLEGEIITGTRSPHPGSFIHREIFRLRPDVNAIIHTHSDITATFSLLGCEIEPFTQLGAALHGDQGVYLGFSGPVRTTNEGRAIAESLGDKAIVIAKNHGLFTANACIKKALWDFVLADMAAKIHLEAHQLGILHAEKLSPELMQQSRIEVRDNQYEFMWSAYLNRIQAKHPELLKKAC